MGVRAMKFGIFDSVDLGAGGAGDVLAGRLRFAAEAECLGVDHYHVTEHHGTPLSVCPSPNLLLAALSQRTERMRLGALVNVLPAHDVFRLAEEVAVLDQLTGGRLDLGVGSGVSPYELGIFGVEAGQAKAIYAEALEALTGALSTGRMRHEGRLLRSYDAELSVLPVQRPHPPLWYASSNTATAEWAGRNGVNFVGRWNGGSGAEAVRAYWEAWHAAGARGPRPCVGIAATVVIAPSREQALDVFGRAYGVFFERLTRLWHHHGDYRPDRAFDPGRLLVSGGALVGTAESVREEMVHQAEASGVNYFELALYFGDQTFDEAAHTLRAVMEQIAPALRARD
ncbi:hypothetical protein GCM10017566_12920 [Amycolatopsis bartoniae]|uniref:Luciferase-like domain-containing protein n=2 Tax=Amycolatopsis bartoniae TaxID=941986 RepID=A0A8H9IW82_9PSEU|nr:hypothetical protein GCM10017566_12920 [Amycolatopsis bartoniae]